MIGPQESPQRAHARELATRGHDILEGTPALEGATSDVELPESDVDEADDEDDERDALQERAAEVEVDTRAAEKLDEGEAKLCYAPSVAADIGPKMGSMSSALGGRTPIT